MEMIVRDETDYAVEGHSLQEIVNFNEVAVLRAMRELFGRDPDLCRCSLCVEDVYALALNSLPPRYIQATSVRTYRGSAHFISEEEIQQQVRQAVDRVRANPNH